MVDDAMDEDDGGKEGRTTEAEVKEMIEEVLKQESLEGRRAASMDIAFCLQRKGRALCVTENKAPLAWSCRKG